ncbi:MAG: ABC transporter ATP-binding protein [Bacillati bacterium ANGP1]|uniref:ABC transporter ATP-binding protein n=1 Tax=Candidatus Segetimicrobium genomatis TaxID=2569760 RepID=A0A537JZ68_9BACT|nr:MAG: ABC transporter ATP-binding protein [Terrabacteria group bacterium ANGP1]HTD48773.1 ABC transporter ATP-binding protein [bacterium]
MLSIEDIHTYYGDSYVLQGVSLEVRPRTAVALLGRNGMGKTTLIRSIIGFARPRQGRVLFEGRDITRLPSHQIAHLGIGLVPQGRRIFPSLTVLEHLSVAARADGAVGNEPWTLDRVFGLYPRLRERHAHRGSMLSGGEQQMLAIARALTTNPRLLLMDEPSEGLAPLLVRELGGSIGRLKEAGLSILLVEQNLPMALAIADEVYVLSKGRVVYRGTPAALSADAAVKHRYLGV